jgi:hypothetical protein
LLSKTSHEADYHIYYRADSDTGKNRKNPNPKQFVTTPTYVAILLALLSCLTVPRINDAFARRREREAREHADETAKADKRRDFIRFLKQWKTEVELFLPPTHIGIIGSHPVEIGYREKVPDFIAEIDRARAAFDDGQFDDLTKRLARLTNKDFNQKNPRDVILEAIDSLVEFAEKP